MKRPAFIPVYERLLAKALSNPSRIDRKAIQLAIEQWQEADIKAYYVQAARYLESRKEYFLEFHAIP